ncbi:hypothetical protein [Anaeromyxobacter paludicola]|uniref:Uncharacterized protein n=1 Tax=Anaeromyxobacter paludicola TaxID=2918171 RepID=A0ABM7XBP8_9BACT|nr:hypothetical protein [Anaeromyxobacter paludicola]BDG09289.1 hypothetical protein AMPC_24020 [Anaeromyxobacter paludicola]
MAEEQKPEQAEAAKAEKRWEKKPATGGKLTLAGLVIVALAGVVLWLASERNARTWFLTPESGALVVKKGMFLPVGRQAFKSSDPGLVAAYAPIPIPAGAEVKDEQAFDDRAQLDEAIFALLAKWATADIATGRPEGLERAAAGVARAEKLPSMSSAQRDELRALRAEVGFFEAKQLLDKAAESLRAAREKLRTTADSSSPRAADAFLLLRQVEPMVEDLYRAQRTAGSVGTPTKPPEGAAQAAPTPATSPAPAPSATP